jgi:hypothetical protein
MKFGRLLGAAKELQKYILNYHFILKCDLKDVKQKYKKLSEDYVKTFGT